MSGLDLLDSAVAEFGRRLSVVGGTRWADPTPCDAWTVRDLVEHVVAGNRLAVGLLTAGREGAEDHDEARESADLITELGRTADRQRVAFERVDPALELAHPAGWITASRFTLYRAADIAVHAWDLARAVGADERLPDNLIERALTPSVEWVAGLEVEGMFGAARGRAAIRPEGVRIVCSIDSGGVRHGETEEHLRASGLATVLLRDNYPLELLCDLVDADGVIRGPAVGGRVAAVAQDDIAAVLTDPGGHDGATYHLTGPE